MPIRFPLNEWQKLAARTYGDGSFAIYGEDEEDIHPNDRQHLITNRIGDTTFYSIMVELDTSEGCNSVQEAASRIRMMMDDMQALHTALELLG